MPRIHMEALGEEESKNRFTLYWLDGRRNVIKGDTIEDAFTKAGYGGGAVRAIDWYDTGISETHRWSKEERKWVKYEPITISHGEFHVLSDEDMTQKLRTLFEQHQSVTVQFENKDELCLNMKFGNFAQIGWVKYIEVVFGEYAEGTYGGEDSEEGDHHFMAYGTQYFHPDNLSSAIIAFIARFNDKPYEQTITSTSLEEIKIFQKDL